MKYSIDQATVIACEIPGQTWPSELQWIYNAVAPSKRHLEIGVYAGRSLFMATHGMESGEAIGVDARVPCPRGVPVGLLSAITDVAVQHCNPSVQTSVITATSYVASTMIHGTFDSIFIDSCHEYESVMKDIQLWIPRLNRHGILFGHDYWANHWGVMEAVNQFFSGSHSVVPDTRIWFVRKDVEND